MNVKELRDKRMRVHQEAVQILGKATQTSEDRSKFNTLMTEVEVLGLEIRKAESNGGIVGGHFTVSDQKHERALAFGKWLRRGEVSPEEKRLIEFRDVAEGDVLAHIGSYTGLGFLVPTGFNDLIENATKYFAPLMDGTVFKLWQTSTGNPIPFPTSNDVSEAAVIVAEAGNITEKDVSASQINFGAYKLTSGVIKASIELLQDAGMDVESWLAERFGMRYGRGLENYLTNGTGGTQPTGLLTAIAASGATPIIAHGSAETSGGGETGVNSIGYTDLVSLEHSVDPTYRRGAKFMLHDLTLASIKKILDKFGRPLWKPGITTGDPDTINGYPYVINQAFPQIGASNVTVAFGDMSKFIVRKVSGFAVQRLNELYATNGQVGFISNMRVDSNLLDAGTHPINVLMQHS